MKKINLTNKTESRKIKTERKKTKTEFGKIKTDFIGP